MFFSLRFGLTLFFINDFLKFDLWAFFFFSKIKDQKFSEIYRLYFSIFQDNYVLLLMNLFCVGEKARQLKSVHMMDQGPNLRTRDSLKTRKHFRKALR